MTGTIDWHQAGIPLTSEWESTALEATVMGGTKCVLDNGYYV